MRGLVALDRKTQMHSFTPGPWKWWTSNSWRRLKRGDPRNDQNVLYPFVARDGHPDLSVNEADMALIAAAPDVYKALVAAEDHLKETLSDPKWHPIGKCPVLEQVQCALSRARGETA